MRSITLSVSIQFDADQVTSGSPREQAIQAIDQINGVLQREPYGLGAQISVSVHDLGSIKVRKIE